jgi:ATP-dependent Clp protease ATP-binding subunit ClpB
VVFKALTLDQIGDIVEMQLEQVRHRLQERKITLDVTPAAVERIGLTGYDPLYGARPLKRVIAKEVVDRVAKAIVEGRVHDGHHVTVDLVGDELAIR